MTNDQFLSLQNNVKYHYKDSGAPDSEAYTTLVFIHGMGFNGGAFKKILSIAASQKCRVVSLYRRDYAPTTPFRDDERALLQQGADHESFIRKQGVEIAQFLLAFIRANDIPSTNSGLGEGGVVLVGWSLGAVHAHAMFAYLDALPEEEAAELAHYLHTVVLHDHSAVAMGFQNPPAYDISLWYNPDEEKRFKLFNDWVTGYYEHGNVLSKNTTRPESVLEFNTPTSKKAASLQDVPFEELSELMVIDTFAGSDMSMLFIGEEVRKTLTRRAIFDTKMAEKYLPALKVVYVCGGETAGIFFYAMWELERAVDNPQVNFGDRAKKAREVEFRYLPKGNHFFFWDDPEWALDQYRQCIAGFTARA
ncbi:hypothetical protein BV22DRAFT_1044343 [Leucogyrophana mollusca]|uniref:Uncharacterized protein n=1 Tax=Leucogyrophana mollusca TaxID=85980 RepID=A0ACB8BT27_9AGAM|nr:hypothetical protein BV22DRAFT_1044343 [Leucogyrophana mollusca]